MLHSHFNVRNARHSFLHFPVVSAPCNVFVSEQVVDESGVIGSSYSLKVLDFRKSGFKTSDYSLSNLIATGNLASAKVCSVSPFAMALSDSIVVPKND